MTRETKIGLLVGLAFIIVIGILLSDHLTSTTEPPPAHLAQAGSSVRQAVSVPGGAGAAQPPVTTLIPQQAVAPQQAVPTREELTPKAPPVQIVQIGPSQGAAGQAQPQPGPGPVVIATPATALAPFTTQAPQPQPAEPQQPAPVTIVPPADVAPPAGPPVVETPVVIATPEQTGTLADVARRYHEELVGLNGEPAPNNPIVTTPIDPAQPDASGAVLAGAREYKAEPGDSLSRMAARFLGANTKANRDAIIRANPSLQKNPDVVISGRTYVIPAVAPAAAPAGPTIAAQPAAPAPAGRAPAAQPEYFYTVKEGDSLWKIADKQLGTPGAIAAIKELNKQTLKGENHDVVYVGMKLRLPAKPLAAAN